jgi:hypothetical protein
MPAPTLSRRAFLAATGGVVLAAAGGTSGLGIGDAGATAPAKKKYGALVLSTDIYASEAPQRLAFALARGTRYASGPRAQLAYGPQIKKRARLGDFGSTVLHDRGLPKARGIYTADIVVPAPGPYVAIAGLKGQEVPFAFQVKEQAEAPATGQPAPRDASPTLASPLGVDPICTRNPQCPLHDVSLDSVVGSGKPVAVMFATPARCESRYCGPVLDDLLTLTDAYADRITFVHVEIYQNLRTARLISTVEAWGLPGEPWLFGIDPGGTLAERLDGAFGTDEQEQLLQRLVA